MWPGCVDIRCKDRLDRDEARLPASRLDVSEASGVGTSGKSGRGRFGASLGALPEETNPECSFVGLGGGFAATDSVSVRIKGARGRPSPSASFVMIVSVLVLFATGAPKTEEASAELLSRGCTASVWHLLAAIPGGCTTVTKDSGDPLRGARIVAEAAECPASGLPYTPRNVLELIPLCRLECRGPGRGGDNELFRTDVPELGLEVFHAVFSVASIPRSSSDE